MSHETMSLLGCALIPAFFFRNFNGETFTGGKRQSDASEFIEIMERKWKVSSGIGWLQNKFIDIFGCGRLNLILK